MSVHSSIHGQLQRSNLENGQILAVFRLFS